MAQHKLREEDGFGHGSLARHWGMMVGGCQADGTAVPPGSVRGMDFCNCGETLFNMSETERAI